MMGSDARDVMGLPSAAPKPATPKVQKPKGRGPTGMIREVLDLKYAGAPPISIVAPKFKEKPKLPFKPRQWEETPFANSARKDGLILRHWRRKGDIVNGGAAMPVTPADSNAASEMETDDKAPPAVPDAYWAKYNVKVERPQYTDEQYETHLKSEDWSKEETDYLVDLATEFDLRWIIIIDRYSYTPTSPPPNILRHHIPQSLTQTPNARRSENALLRHRRQNNAAEFSAHEKMTKYDGAQETKRKKYAELLFSRPKEEKEEEEYYLRELSRIVANQEKLSQDRKALYDRLDAAPSSTRDSYSTTMYQSSQGLTQLMQNLFTQNKNKELERKGEKRRSLLEAGEASNNQYGADRSQRHSLSGVGGSNNRLSTSADPHSTGARRPLTQHEERKYGVSHPAERLTGGIQFRHERITKAGQAKSGVQTSRIGAALTELKIPPRLTMPTARVVTEYERLIEGIKGLLEVRKVSEKVDGEIRVLQAQKEQMEARERGEDIKEEEGTGQEVQNHEDEEDDGAKTQNRNEESKVEDDNEDDNDDENEDEEEKDEEKDDSDEEANQDDSDNNASEDDAEGEVDESAVAVEMQDLQEDEEGEAQEQEDGDGEDEDGEDEDGEGENDDDETSSRGSAAPNARSEGLRKRSASDISHVSNRSSKRQKK
ncbi:hypothetical protein OEA41_002998 [Lepraria neglecta]|uniref:SWR1-complex protein 4 n=1 Tax=Lepraria neglecta TaxID=209136 RepID=A0AAD9Z3S4_9LECA|nr:hypothetical protein OEA41_002998 [Lepraria neglecta]